MFFLSLILLVLLPLSVLSSDVWLELREKQLEADTSTLEAELESLSQQFAADSNEVDALDTEVSEIAHSEQVFIEGPDQRSLWRPDARWSEMGKARVQEIWRQRGILGDKLAQSRTLARQKKAELIQMLGRKDQITYLRQLIKEHTFMLYGVLLFGAFAVMFFALLWVVLVQSKVNAILRRWA